MNITYVKTTEDRLNSVPVIDGQEIYASDTSNRYSDFNGLRRRNVFGSEIEAIVNEYGAKNLVPNTASSDTINGVTFTVNADGSVTANGTATDNAFLNLSNKDFGNEAIGTYLNMPKEANGFIISDGIVSEHEQFYGIGYDPNNNNVIFILIMSGYTANNLTFYPMIRDARIKDSTYVPYAMTNAELTESTLKYVKVSKSSFTWDTSTLTFKCPNPPSEVVKNKGFVVKPLNGMAIMGGYYSTISGYLYVFGWIPSNAQSVNDEYDFDCYILI